MAFEPIYMYAPDGRKALVGSAIEREQLRVKGYSEAAPKVAELSPNAQDFIRKASAPKPAAKPEPKPEPAPKSTSK